MILLNLVSMFLTNTRNILKINDSSAFRNYSLELDCDFYFEEKRSFCQEESGVC